MIVLLLGIVLLFVVVCIFGYCLIGATLLAKMAHFTYRKRHPNRPQPPTYPDTAAGRFNRAMDERGRR